MTAIAPAGAAPGAMTDVAARITAIQSRIDGLVGGGAGRTMPTFELAEATSTAAATADGGASASTATTTRSGSAGPATVGATTAGAAASAGSTDPKTVDAAAGAAVRAPSSGDARGEVLAARLPEHGRHLAPAIEDAAVRAGIEPSLLAALVRHESNFDQDVVSHAGAIGLGQLMPGTAAGLGVDPHDPLENLDGAARYLREQIDRFGAPDLALAAYNAGPNRVAQAGGVPRIAETQTYVGRVMSTWEQLR